MAQKDKVKMAFNFNDYIKKHRTPDDCNIEFVQVLPKIKCADGFSLSVQASEFHYSSPRENVLDYDAVEVGYPSEAVPELMEYAEDAERPTHTVYGWVPVSVVNSIIDAHGGAESEQVNG